MPAWWLVVQCPQGQKQEQVGAPAHKDANKKTNNKTGAHKSRQLYYYAAIPSHSRPLSYVSVHTVNKNRGQSDKENKDF